MEVGSHVCLPGEPILQLEDHAVLVIGSGIAKAGRRTLQNTDGEVLVATVCGPLMRERGLPGQPWVYRVVSGGRYRPKRGDPVVATVTKVLPMSYMVSIGGAHAAVLDGLAFDGASKSSRPRLRVGDHVYCHVAVADADADVVVSCCAFGNMEAKEWTTGESTFGVLQRGCVVRVAPSYAKSLTSESSLILSLLGQRAAFEVAVGCNGRVWVRGVSTDPRVEQSRTVAVAACIVESQNDATSIELEARVASYFTSTGVLCRTGGSDAAASHSNEVQGDTAAPC